MIVDDFAPLDLSRYKLRLRACQAISLPPFLGSTLRGAFGHALKEAVCVMSHRDCERCLLADRCVYPYLFETPAPSDVHQLRGQKQAPHPFILAPPFLSGPDRVARIEHQSDQSRVTAHSLSDGRVVRLVPSSDVVTVEARRHLRAGDELTFGLLLMGRAIECLPYVIYAVSEMARRGLGADRARFELTEVAILDERGASKPIYTHQSQRITLPQRATSKLSEWIRARLDTFATAGASSADALRLRFLTPARIRVYGDLQVEVSFGLLVRNLLRRLSLLATVHGSANLEMDYPGLIELAESVETRRSDLRWWDWERYSNRQRGKMALGGFIGETEYAGEAIKQLLPLVIAGEFLHVGTGTSFGLGKYKLIT
jgi:CRISPR-associated endoribonuclease Cas6